MFTGRFTLVYLPLVNRSLVTVIHPWRHDTGFLIFIPVFNVNFNNAVYILLKNGLRFHDDVPTPHIIPTLHLCLCLSRTFRSLNFVGMGSFRETRDEKRIHVSIDSQQVDTGAQLDASLQTPLDPDESLRIR